jgi:hypothetical protein
MTAVEVAIMAPNRRYDAQSIAPRSCGSWCLEVFMPKLGMQLAFRSAHG